MMDADAFVSRNATQLRTLGDPRLDRYDLHATETEDGNKCHHLAITWKGQHGARTISFAGPGVIQIDADNIVMPDFMSCLVLATRIEREARG